MSDYALLLIGGLLICLATSLLVGAARSKVATVSTRIRTIVAGLICLVSAFTCFWITTSHHTDSGANALVPVILVGGAVIGCFSGYWYGHRQRPIS